MANQVPHSSFPSTDFFILAVAYKPKLPLLHSKMSSVSSLVAVVLTPIAIGFLLRFLFIYF